VQVQAQPLVLNEALMDNHKSELAEALEERKFFFCARPETLEETILHMNLGSLLPYPLSIPMAAVESINGF